jgi:hypothetical protein
MKLRAATAPRRKMDGALGCAATKALLEHVAELEEPLVVPRIADTASQKHRAYDGFGKNSRGEVVGKAAFVPSANQHADLLACVQAGRQCKAVFQAHDDGVLKCALILPPAIRQILVRSLSADDDVPILRADQLRELLGSLTSGVQSSDEAPMLVPAM